MGAIVKFNSTLAAKATSLLEAQKKRFGKHEASVGIHEESESIKQNYKGDITAGVSLIDVALAMEFGGGNAPPRPWLRAWFDANKSRLKEEMVDAARASFAAGDDQALKEFAARQAYRLGEWVRDDLGAVEPLADATIAARRRAGLADYPPLVATGQMLAAIKGMLDGDFVS